MSIKIKKAEIYYARIERNLSKEQKLWFLEAKQHIFNIDLKRIFSDIKNNWLTDGLEADFDTFTPLGSKEGKGTENQAQGVVFKTYSNGVKTNRDVWAYNFKAEELAKNMRLTIENYNEHVFRYSRLETAQNIDDFVSYDDTKLSWSESLKASLKRAKYTEFQKENVRTSLYRPFSKQFLYFGRMFNERVYQFPSIFPTPETEQENKVICLGGYGRKGFAVVISNHIPDLNFYGDPQQSLPFYIYNEDGSHRQKNLTDWALKDYQSHYTDENISKWDIFYGSAKEAVICCNG